MITKVIVCGLVVLVTISYIFVKFIAIITGSNIVGIIILVYVIYKVLKLIGNFALFPGSLQFIKSDY